MKKSFDLHFIWPKNANVYCLCSCLCHQMILLGFYLHKNYHQKSSLPYSDQQTIENHMIPAQNWLSAGKWTKFLVQTFFYFFHGNLCWIGLHCWSDSLHWWSVIYIFIFIFIHRKSILAMVSKRMTVMGLFDSAMTVLSR